MEPLSIAESHARPLPGSAGEPPADERETAIWSSPISLQAFVQRVSLMADLELPCMVCLGDTTVDRCCRGVIRECHRRNGHLSLRGDDFSLHLVEDHIDSLRLVHRHRSGDTETALEIFGNAGTLTARILSTPDRTRAAVWQDIMDTFTFVPA